MPRFSIDELRILYDEIVLLSKSVEEMYNLANESTGETRSAFAIVHKDYLWKIQKKIGDLWFYVCSSDVMNPFEETTRPESESS